MLNLQMRCNKIGHKAAQYRSRVAIWEETENLLNNPYTRGERKPSILQNLQCFVCGGQHIKHVCSHRYDATSKRAKLVEDCAPQRKFDGMMMCTFAPKSTSCDMDKYKITLESGATM